MFEGSVLVSSGWHKKYHRLYGLNSRHLFLTVLEAGKAKIKVQAGSVPGEDSLLACGWPPSHCVLT